MKGKQKNRIIGIALIALLLLQLFPIGSVFADAAQNSVSYTENGGPVSIIDNNNAVSIDPAVNFADGYLLFNVSNGQPGDVFTIPEPSNPNEEGVISQVDGSVYVGTGNERQKVGVIDSELNGRDGKSLKVILSSPMTNSSFEDGINGWTVTEGYIPLEGDTGAANIRTSAIVVTNSGGITATEGQNFLEMNITGSVTEGYGTAHGPSVTSSYFEASAGDKVVLDWYAIKGSDNYDIRIYLINDGTKTELHSDQGATTNGWAQLETTIPEDGDKFQFEFLNGTHDATGGKAVGSKLLIDNVRVFSSLANGEVAASIANSVAFYSDSDTPTDTKREWTLETVNADGHKEPLVSSGEILVTPVPDPPTGTITINNGDQVTNSLDVILSLTAQGIEGPIEFMSFSNDGANWGDWELFDATATYTILPGDGEKTVYVKYKDATGVESIAEIKDSIILDTIAPTAIFEYSTVDPTNGDVTAKIVLEDANGPVTITNNGGKDTFTFTENGEFTFTFVDAVGNEGSATVYVTNIDKEAPTASVEYSTVDPTNKDVVATLTLEDVNGPVTITNNGGSNEYTFTENGQFTFEFVDALGNEGSYTVSVNNIDKEAPEATVEYSTEAPTNEDVVATIELTDANGPVTITNNDGSNEYTFTKNGEFTFEYVDALGNKGSYTATVENIDKEAPEASIEYSTEAPTRGNVVATINLTDVNGPVTITNNGGSNVHTFTENGEFTFEYVDALGNKGSYTATVNNIDREAPEASVELSTEEPTNKDVVATIDLTDVNGPVTITNNGGSSEYTFSENGEFTFEYVDALGNAGSYTVTVDNIDKTAPTAIAEYSTVDPTSGDVIVTLIPSEFVTILNNDGSDVLTFTENGEFTFEYVDAGGNTGSYTVTVNNIDKEAPTASVELSTEEPTNKDIVATIELEDVNGPVTITNNGGSNEYTFTENGEFTFEYVDALGNAGSYTVTVDNIDKTAPTAKAEYKKVNGKVVVTLIPSEDVTILNNDGSNQFIFTENGEFTFEFIDAAGNKGTFTVKVDDLDKGVETLPQTGDDSHIDVMLNSMIVFVAAIGLAMLLITSRRNKKDRV
ncbi:MAG TPA: hypothetical protein VKZ62_00240 [Georgenia sp.]|nr:hypothetical protein [Georgenia sp.]